jgi:hypothetical protein
LSGYTTAEIYCHNEKWHENDQPVEKFAQTGPAEWVPLSELTEGRRTAQRIDASTDTYLDPSAPLRPHIDVRDRYPLRCDVCGVAVTVRAERLGVILDTLATHGMNSISLKGLAATLVT